ncbi:helix-turn-helix domain-containing protein [Myroides guanonis]|uniref:AraC-type DNA-binding protein n=1 Tax=Myroides guanonis TaxID=1150112 RepID=A0A1I3L5V4_9FLAO|nr:helix-turn-helix domain-containing protein [Myroides guanonis]SFI79896.1 AraC-type DNA-binding protein [Myroides guanonis]
MKIIFLLLVSLLSVHHIQAQTNSTSTFDSIYYKTANKILGLNSDEALVVADSLYQSSESGLLKLQALMLSANIYQSKNNQVASIKHAREAYYFAVKENNYSWQARICVFLSSQYRNIGLLEEGRDYINKALEVNSKVSNSSSKKLQIALIEQELAYYALLKEKYKDVLEHVSNYNKLLDELVESPNLLYQKTYAAELSGRAYLGLKLYDQAEKSFLKGLDILNDLGYSEGSLSGFIYMGLGEVFVETKNDTLALNYFELAEIRARSCKHLNLEIAICKQITDLYKRNENWELYNVYLNSFDSLKTIDRNLRSSAIQDAFNINKEEHKKSEVLARVYLGGVIILVLLLTAFVLWIRIKKNRDYKKFKVLIDNPKLDNRRVEEQNEQKPQSGFEKKRVLSLEAELKILEHLKRFEEELEFLKPNISLSSLAAFCDTNTRYLSYVLNQNIGKDFNSYLNELRVKYGIEKLENDPVFRTYKISYLAEFLGFSSHSKFTAVFKEITNLAPSAFIAYLEEESDKK